MYGYKYTSKNERWVSNGSGGQVLKRTYTYHRDDGVLGILFLGFLLASPWLIARKIKERKRLPHRKSFAERLERWQQRSMERLHQSRQSLWDTIKNKRIDEDDMHWMKRLQRYGFTRDGVHIKTGIQYQLNTERGKNSMQIDIKEKLKKLESETFYTVKKIPFTYTFVNENSIQISNRKPYPISLSNFEKAIEINPEKPSEITKIVRGSSYVFAIINDRRFH